MTRSRYPSLPSYKPYLIFLENVASDMKLQSDHVKRRNVPLISKDLLRPLRIIVGLQTFKPSRCVGSWLSILHTDRTTDFSYSWFAYVSADEECLLEDVLIDPVLPILLSMSCYVPDFVYRHILWPSRCMSIICQSFCLTTRMN